VVYRGAALPDFEGKLIFGDWAQEGGEPTGVMYLASRPENAGESWSYEPITVVGGFPHYLLSLAYDQAGEVYALTHDMQGPEGESGKVWKLTPPAE
jgi:hypothetical protein